MKWCLQEFFDFKCACGKKHPSALSHATFSVRLCCFYAFLYLLHSYLSVYFHVMNHLTLQMTILANVPGISKVCLQENLVDCADCGGLAPAQYLGVFIKTFLYGITVKIAHVKEALRSLAKCLQDNSSSR